MDYHTITDLKPMNKFNWKIRVRVTKKWLQRIPRTQYCNGLNLILVDEDHERIHAWIGESILNYFDQIFHEGNTYEIKNFVVKFYETTEIDRCFKDEQHIIMSHLTKARKLYISHTIIPFDVCKFTDISFIPQLQHNINHYIDVVGIVYSVDPMEVSMYDGEDGVSSISFWVSDNLKKVKIIFYGQLAQLLDVSLMQVNEYPAVIAVKNCKVLISHDMQERTLLNNEPTGFILNPDIPIVSIFKSKKKVLGVAWRIKIRFISVYTYVM